MGFLAFAIGMVLCGGGVGLFSLGIWFIISGMG